MQNNIKISILKETPQEAQRKIAYSFLYGNHDETIVNLGQLVYNRENSLTEAELIKARTNTVYDDFEDEFKKRTSDWYYVLLSVLAVIIFAAIALIIANSVGIAGVSINIDPSALVFFGVILPAIGIAYAKSGHNDKRNLLAKKYSIDLLESPKDKSDRQAAEERISLKRLTEDSATGVGSVVSSFASLVKSTDPSFVLDGTSVYQHAASICNWLGVEAAKLKTTPSDPVKDFAVMLDTKLTRLAPPLPVLTDNQKKDLKTFFDSPLCRRHVILLQQQIKDSEKEDVNAKIKAEEIELKREEVKLKREEVEIKKLQKKELEQKLKKIKEPIEERKGSKMKDDDHKHKHKHNPDGTCCDSKHKKDEHHHHDHGDLNKSNEAHHHESHTEDVPDERIDVKGLMQKIRVLETNINNLSQKNIELEKLLNTKAEHHHHQTLNH